MVMLWTWANKATVQQHYNAYYRSKFDWELKPRLGGITEISISLRRQSEIKERVLLSTQASVNYPKMKFINM